MEIKIDNICMISEKNIWSSRYNKLIVVKLNFINPGNFYLQNLSRSILSRINTLNLTTQVFSNLPNSPLRLFLASTIAAVAHSLQLFHQNDVCFHKGYVINDSIYYAAFSYKDAKTGIEAAHTSVAMLNEITNENNKVFQNPFTEELPDQNLLKSA